MKIYIDNEHNIRQINTTNDDTLTEIEVDREHTFSDMSDYLILNYKYIPTEDGYSLIPSKNLEELLVQDYRNKVDEQTDKISILEKKVAGLKAINNEQDNILVDNAYKIALLEINAGGGL